MARRKLGVGSIGVNRCSSVVDEYIMKRSFVTRRGISTKGTKDTKYRHAPFALFIAKESITRYSGVSRPGPQTALQLTDGGQIGVVVRQGLVANAPIDRPGMRSYNADERLAGGDIMTRSALKPPVLRHSTRLVRVVALWTILLLGSAVAVWSGAEDAWAEPS